MGEVFLGWNNCGKKTKKMSEVHERLTCTKSSEKNMKLQEIIIIIMMERKPTKMGHGQSQWTDVIFSDGETTHGYRILLICEPTSRKNPKEKSNKRNRGNDWKQ